MKSGDSGAEDFDGGLLLARAEEAANNATAADPQSHTAKARRQVIRPILDYSP